MWHRIARSFTKSKSLSYHSNKLSGQVERAVEDKGGPEKQKQQQQQRKHAQPSNQQCAYDMGKSNKFDCTNRRNEGVELGKSIGDAAIKELEKCKKDATRQAGKARKSSSGSMFGSDGEISNTHTIDLIVPGKALTDGGVAAMVEGLHAAMEAGGSQASIVLEGINLRDNRLTARALATLAPIIDLAQNELKTVVLSANEITVNTDEQVQQWEAFLASFKDCKAMRRLDLSNNPALGPRALESFCKIHCREPAVDPIALGGDNSTWSVDEMPEHDESPATPDSGDYDRYEDRFKHMTAGGYLHRRAGLRSIPYISLNNVGINDHGALWLSYVLESHCFPNQLVNNINTAPALTSVDAYQQDAVEGGIDWADNQTTLGRDGLYILSKTEIVRKQLLYDDASSAPTQSIADPSAENSHSRRFSKVSVGTISTLGTRRSSVRSVHTDDGGEHEVSDLESIRRRIQRHIIEDRGISSIDLWNSAISVITTSRKLALIAPATDPQKQSVLPCLLIDGEDADSSAAAREDRLDSAANINNNVSPSSKPDDNTSPPASVSRKASTSYAKAKAAFPPVTPGEPENAFTEVTNTPATPKRNFRAHRKEVFSEGSDLQGLSERLSGFGFPHAKLVSNRFLKWQTDKIKRETLDQRELSSTSKLPISIFDRICAFTLAKSATTKTWTIGAEGEVVSPQNGGSIFWPGKALLSKDQLREAYDWGQKRETLSTERDWLRMADSGQLWKLMNEVGCLTYSK